MLNLINFSHNDDLYIIGDICDRGGESEKIYIDVMARSNVFCLKGNHELMAEKVLPYMLGFRKMPPQRIYNADYNVWLQNGGNETINAIYRCREKTQMKICDFIEEMPLIKDGLKIGDREFILVHAGLHGYTPDRILSEYLPYDLLWARPDYDLKLWEDENKFLVVGHTPTMFLSKMHLGRIYKGKGSFINIDCGEAYRKHGGRLGCLCLDTLEEFYV